MCDVCILSDTTLFGNSWVLVSKPLDQSQDGSLCVCDTLGSVLGWHEPSSMCALVEDPELRFVYQRTVRKLLETVSVLV